MTHKKDRLESKLWAEKVAAEMAESHWAGRKRDDDAESAEDVLVRERFAEVIRDMQRRIKAIDRERGEAVALLKVRTPLPVLQGRYTLCGICGGYGALRHCPARGCQGGYVRVP